MDRGLESGWTMTHVDDFVDRHDTDVYASWMLFFFRLPAVLQIKFRHFFDGKKLFCTWKDKRWRVTGASRFGDVWLTSDFTRDAGYDHRVEIDECSKWGPTAMGGQLQKTELEELRELKHEVTRGVLLDDNSRVRRKKDGTWERLPPGPPEPPEPPPPRIA